MPDETSASTTRVTRDSFWNSSFRLDKQRVDAISVVVAAFVQTVGTFLLALGKFEDPFWRLVASGLALLLSSSVCWRAVFPKSLRSPIESASGEEILSKPERAKPATRWACGILFVLALAWFAAECYRSFLAPPDLVRISDPIFLDDPPGFRSDDAINVQPAVGNGPVFFDDLQRYLRRLPTDQAGEITVERARRWYGESPGEAIEFSIYKQDRAPWLRIDNIRAVVELYMPPPHHALGIKTSAPTFIIVVEMDKPLGGKGPAEFYPKFVLDDPSTKAVVPWRNQSWFINDDRPQKIILKLGAKTAGLYRYSVYMDVSSRWERQTVTLCEHRQCIFVGGDGAPDIPADDTLGPAPPPALYAPEPPRSGDSDSEPMEPD